LGDGIDWHLHCLIWPLSLAPTDMVKCWLPESYRSSVVRCSGASPLWPTCGERVQGSPDWEKGAKAARQLFTWCSGTSWA